MPTDPRTARIRRWGIGLAVWTALGLLATTQTALFLTSQGREVPWATILIDRMADWYTCAIFTPAYFWLVRRYPLGGTSWRSSLPVLLLATIVFVVLKYAILLGVLDWLGQLSPGTTLGTLLRRGFIMENIVFWAVLAAVQAIDYQRRYREREVETARLEAGLRQAQLDALAAQLRPHFLFNTLQSISTLIHRDPKAADAMLARLSDLLRANLTLGQRHQVTLVEELAVLEHYLAILRVRFGNRLTVSQRIGPNLKGAAVPNFILQPLIENAIEHGIASRSGPGHVAIVAERRGRDLALVVEDNGADATRTTETPTGDGIGLSNTRRRLTELYGPRHAMTLELLPERGFRVTLTIPLEQGAG